MTRLHHRPPERPAAGMWICVLGVLLFAMPAVTNAQSFMTTEFKVGEVRPRTLVLLPPHAQFIKAKVVMTSQMIEESHALEDKAADSIADELRERGYEVRVLTIGEINADSQLQDLVRNLNSRHDEEWSKMVRRPRQVRAGRYGIGDVAVRLAAQLGVEGVLMVRVIAVQVSGGTKALSMLFSLGSSYPRSYTRVDLALIDGNNGEIEAYFYEFETTKSKILLRKPEKIMGNAYRKCLSRYPQVDEVLEIKAGEMAKAADSEEDAVDESILADFEALLAATDDEAGDSLPRGFDPDGN